MFLRELCLETNIKPKIQEHETFIISNKTFLTFQSTQYL